MPSPRVFVSHATVDTLFVEAFVDTILRDCGLSRADIVVSSIPGMDLPVGSDLLAEVRKRVTDATLVIAVITPTYQTRPVCVAELGAAWGVSGKLIPLLAPGVERASLEGVLPFLKTAHLDKGSTLDALRDEIERVTGLSPDSSATWTRAKEKWLGRVSKLAKKLDAPDVLTETEIADLRQSSTDLREALAEAEAENQRLEDLVAQLKTAKDADAVKKITLPKKQIDRFELLRREAEEALREVPWAVRRMIWIEEAGGQGRWPSIAEDPGFHERFHDAIEDGLLAGGGEDEPVELNRGIRVVNEAVEAVRELVEWLHRTALDDEFVEWFDEEYGGDPDLSPKVIWESVFPRL